MTPQEVDTLREALITYGEVYKVNICDIDFYFRLLTRREFSLLNESSEDGFDFEDNISAVCAILPLEFDFATCKAGIPAMLSLVILDMSGYGKESELRCLQEARLLMGQLEYQMDAVIMTAFPQYRDDELENLPKKYHFELFAKAEWALRELRGLVLADIAAPQNETQVPLAPPPIP